MQPFRWVAMAKRYIVCVVVWALFLCPAAGLAQSTDERWQPGLHEWSSMALLAGAQDALAQLENEQTQFQRRIYLTGALSSLSALYQLHGLEWALARLLPLYEDPDCPEIHFGYSGDGRLRLTVEPLELKNPAFSEYTVLLVTLESNTGKEIRAASFGSLEVKLPGGITIIPEQLSPGHELWERVKQLADTFEPPPFIYPGAATAFKQVFALKDLGSKRVLAVSLEWDGYTIGVPYYENQAEQE